ncbi:MAG TPA: efflux RND transporter periplasmic adaptor subunit [Deltaproteobacteria bacterium]|nr:efflux RND transporter periplasmic adaptor subunit [Deltaproteobacteria bacterium]HOI06550.1 efflux RND transporter periplasmic adaptor subunit [Deltaproteobacteria bacterium]
MTKRMVIMLAAVLVVFGGIFGYKAFMDHMMKKYMAAAGMPPVTVSAVKAAFDSWQPQIKAVGSLRAVRGVDVASEIAGLVESVHFTSGDEAKAGQVLLQLNADTDTAQLQAMQAAADLAKSTYERDKKQLEAQAISLSTLEADEADLRAKQAQVSQQAALVAKKTIRAPFAGRLGIASVNPGQYVNPGDRIVTLQSLDSLLVDFLLPQQELSRISKGLRVMATADAYPEKSFTGVITAINPRVEDKTRNVRVEARIDNPGRVLLPGMFVTVEVEAGEPRRYLTLPRTAVVFNPYGETVYIVENKGTEEKPALTARQTFVTVGPSRGDQVAVLKGVREGDLVVTSGQLKLRSGSPVVVDNRVQPLSDPDPRPADG